MLRSLASPRGAVTAPHHLAAQAGAAILRDGGNAVEAMVAAAAAIAVVYPHMNGLGGDGFWLISRPGQPPIGIDACGRSAALATPDWYRKQGFDSIPTRGALAANTMSGAVSGWAMAMAQVPGRLPLPRLLDDAIHYARDGVPVTQSQINYTSRFLPELALQPGFAPTYLRGEQLPVVHTPQRFPALAGTLERLAAVGLDDYYRGAIARRLAAELEHLGSPLRQDDFRRHAATVVDSLQVNLSVGTAFNLPPPTQGLASLMILGLFDRVRDGVQPDSFDHVHRLVEATKLAFLVRNRLIRDPLLIQEQMSSFLAAGSIAERARRIDYGRARPWPGPSLNGDTVWMGAADRDGCMVSYIQSVYWEFGSGVVLTDTGITWQNRGASFSLDKSSHLALAPDRKPFHTLNPAFARLSDGREVVYGNMGGDGQPQSQAAVFTRYAMFGQDLQQAISAPRWLLGRTWGQMSVSLKVEGRFDASTIESMRAAGHEVEVVDSYSDLVGHAGALSRTPSGVVVGATDPRSDGAVAGV